MDYYSRTRRLTHRQGREHNEGERRDGEKEQGPAPAIDRIEHRDQGSAEREGHRHPTVLTEREHCLGAATLGRRIEIGEQRKSGDDNRSGGKSDETAGKKEPGKTRRQRSKEGAQDVQRQENEE